MVTSLFEVPCDVRFFRSCRLRAVSTQLPCFGVNVLQLGRFHLLALLWRLLKLYEPAPKSGQRSSCEGVTDVIYRAAAAVTIHQNTSQK